jgi:alanyl-tRNA synthetase
VLTAVSAFHDRGDGTFEAKLHESPFYAAGGGQVSDGGVLLHDGTGAEAVLREAIRLEGDDQVLVFEGSGFAEGDRVRAVVAWSDRFPTMANHTATHLLHKALQDVLGDHVRQAGSAVRPDKLRFDFTHPQALTPEERAEIERRVNEKIFENLPVHAFVTPIEEARKLGAMMLFGEKYGDQVRVIEIPGYSRELCGGTHVRWTAEIGPFAILSEASVGAGARRIEAVTSGEAYALLHGARHESEELRRELEAVRKEARKPKADGQVDITWQERVGDVVYVQTKDLSGGRLREFSDSIRQKEKADGVVAASVADSRAFIVLNFAPTLGVDASELVKTVGPIIEGGGGGRPTLAEAGGKNPDRLPDAYKAVRDAIAALK